MSIAEFYIENGIDPFDPNHVDQICQLACGADQGTMTVRADDAGGDVSDIQSVTSENEDCATYHIPYQGKYIYDSSDIPDPMTNSIWSSLCSDNRWRYKPSSEELYFSEIEGRREAKTINVIPVPAEGMHPGALAPKWVFEAKPTKVDGQSLEAYMQCLMCVLCGRFVVMGDSKFSSSQGIRQLPRWSWNRAERYDWRYWDNAGNVYEVRDENYRDRVKHDMRGQQMKDVDWKMLVGDRYGSLPGDFRTSLKIPLWMRVYVGEKSYTNFGDFWDTIWNWKHAGTTYCSKWDQHLYELAKTAGVPLNTCSKSWPLQEVDLDSTAKQKGWSKLECKQPAMASYCKGDTRLNFYLSTGTVGSCLDHPSKGKTQLFRKYMENPMSLFDNPRAHTGTGYYKKENDSSKVEKRGTKRKADTGQCHLRTCATCQKEKPIEQFSKNQRKKGSKSKCIQCV